MVYQNSMASVALMVFMSLVTFHSSSGMDLIGKVTNRDCVKEHSRKSDNQYESEVAMLSSTIQEKDASIRGLTDENNALRNKIEQLQIEVKKLQSDLAEHLKNTATTVSENGGTVVLKPVVTHSQLPDPDNSEIVVKRLPSTKEEIDKEVNQEQEPQYWYPGMFWRARWGY